jgi:photosystem I reaction center PsaK
MKSSSQPALAYIRRATTQLTRIQNGSRNPETITMLNPDGRACADHGCINKSPLRTPEELKNHQETVTFDQHLEVVHVQIMVASTTAFLVAGRFGVAPTATKNATAGLKLVPANPGLKTGDPAGKPRIPSRVCVCECGCPCGRVWEGECPRARVCVWTVADSLTS